MSKPDIVQSEINDFSAAIVSAVLEEAKGGPHVTIDLAELSDGEILQLMSDHPDADIEKDYDDRYVSAKIQDKVAAEKRRATFFLAVDVIDRRYGGPQEGGWWFDVGEVVDWDPVRVRYSENGLAYISAAENLWISEIAAELCLKFDFGTSHRSSVVPKDEDYRWRITTDIPEDWSSWAPYC